MGTPVYFGSMTALCKAVPRSLHRAANAAICLANKVGGVVAVGGVRNGGQELTIQCVQSALLCQEMLVVATAGRLPHGCNGLEQRQG